GDQRQMAQLVTEIGRGDPAGAAGVDHPRQGVDEGQAPARHGLEHLGRFEPVEITGVAHRGLLPRGRLDIDDLMARAPRPVHHNGPPCSAAPGPAGRRRSKWTNWLRGRAVDDAEGQIAREIAREQTYADRLYARLD